MSDNDDSWADLLAEIFEDMPIAGWGVLLCLLVVGMGICLWYGVL